MNILTILFFLIFAWLNDGFKLPFWNHNFKRIVKFNNYQNELIKEVCLRVSVDDGIDRATVNEGPKITLQEYFTQPYVDKITLAWLLAGQGLLINLSLIIGFFAGYNPYEYFTINFNNESLVLASQFAVAMFAVTRLLDFVPLPIFQKFEIETRMYTLRLLGRNTPIVLATFVAMLASAGAGFSEELFFRGLLFPIIEEKLGLITAYVLTSSLFGLAHSPIFGANAFVEAIFGGIFAFLFVFSGYNLAVPIVAHTLYDFLTMIVIWYVSSTDLKRRMTEAANRKLVMLSKSDENAFNNLSKALFDSIDRNKDGNIDENELNACIKLFGVEFSPFNNTSAETKEFMNQYDKNRDGLIDFDEFVDILKIGLFKSSIK